MTDGIRTGELVASPVAVVRARVGPQHLERWLHWAHRVVAQRLAKDRIEASGSAFARYTLLGDQVEIEAGYPVPVAVPGDDLIVASGLPGGPVAITVHLGHWDIIDPAYHRLGSWLADNGLHTRGRHWERYPVGIATGEGDPQRWRTEIVVPYHPLDGDSVDARAATGSRQWVLAGSRGP